ncbi:MAG: kelch repeat-containing protein [Anaerolineae bacterium]
MVEDRSTSLLSERELEVLKCLTTGASNREIAQTLVISPNTVKVHIRNIYEKLGVQSRAEATRRAIEEGWVQVENQPPAAPRADTTPSPQASRALPLRPWQRAFLLFALLIAVIIFVLPQLPSGRSEVVALEEPLFGQCNPAATSTSEVMPTERWEPHANIPTARARFALVAHERRLYAIGGLRVSGPTSLVEVYDPADESWREGPSKPTQAANVKGQVLNDRIYVPGGCDEQGQALNVLEVLDPATNTWSTAADLPAPRCAYALTARDERLYLVGGSDGANFVNTVFVYDPATDSWSTDAPPLPLSLGFSAAATLNDDIYLAGGYDGVREYADTFILRPDAPAWEVGPALTTARGGLGLVETGGTLYAIGGGWNTYLSSNELLNAAQGTWEPFETPRLRWLNPGLATIDTNIYAVGGADGQCLSTNQSYRTLFRIFLPR